MSTRDALIEVVAKAAREWLHPASWVRHDNGESLNVNVLAAAVVDALRVEHVGPYAWEREEISSLYRIGALEVG